MFVYAVEDVSLKSYFCVLCRTDFSQPGHILGSPIERSTQAISERNLSPSSNTLLRVLTHMAMFIGANEHIEVTPFLDFYSIISFLYYIHANVISLDTVDFTECGSDAPDHHTRVF